jgi:regulator of sigma E protease
MDLCLIAATGIDYTAWLNWALSIGMVAAGLGFVIFVHELGHFLAAKACGVKAEKFYVGFDIPMPKILGWQIPSTFGKFQWGETEYGIGILPLGGYVKMLGQDDDPRKYKDEQARALAEGTAAVGHETTSDAPQNPVPEQPASFDPRSYQSKSVPQRMLIISAGVIMNLIFAVIMGAAAYSMGVPYIPTVIGHAPAGSPGWTQDLRPGDKVLRIGQTGYESESLRWEQDLIPKILLSNGAEIELLIQRDDQEPFVVPVRGRKHPQQNFSLLGVGSSHSTTVAMEFDPAVLAGRPDAKTLPQPGDRIVAIDGQPLPEGHHAFPVLQRALAARPGETFTLKVERRREQAPDERETLEVQLPPQPLRTLGLVMEVGPVFAVRQNGPADRAGIKAGDKLVSIDGQPIGDPLTLSQRLLPLVGQADVPIEVERTTPGRKNTETLTLKIHPEAPIFMDTGASSLGGDMAGIEPLGLALPVEFKVAEVSGSAAAAGLQPGDELVSVRFQIADPEVAERVLRRQKEQITLEPELRNFVWIHGLLQMLPVETELEVTYLRGNQAQTATLTPAPLEGFYFEQRGLGLTQLREIHTAATAGEAWYLGYRETKEKLKEVAGVLRGLITGQVSFRNLGSPIMIAQAAYSEASQGWGRLLIFLTFLSANLALVNFLPIPVLDGGHMVFLLAEGIRGKPLDENVQYYALLVGAAMLLGLMLFVFSNDIVRLMT